MANRPIGYGGDPSRQPKRTGRQVHAPGTGNVRTGPAPENQPPKPRPAPQKTPEQLELEHRTQEFRDTYGFDPPQEFTESWQRAYTDRAQTRPAPEETDGFAAPDAAQNRPAAAAPRRRPPMTEAQARAVARRARELRRQRARLAVLGTIAGVLILSGVITMLLPKGATRLDTAGETTPEQAEGMAQNMVAPLPYAGDTGSAGSTEPVIDWGNVGPARQTETYTLTSAPAAADPTTLPELGRVDTSWFGDAAFLGDSLTAGIAFYDINVGNALVCGYEGTSPNQIVNRTTLNNDDRGEEIPLDVLSAAPPAKLYVLLGTNALVGTGNDEGFMNYYALMLDALKETLPNTALYVQSVLPVRPEALESAPGLSPERLASINDRIRALCAEKGCYFLNLTEALAGEDGYLREDIAQSDGIHLTPTGYTQWIDYLCTHVPYNKNNPYQADSAYYLTDSMKQLLADLP